MIEAQNISKSFGRLQAVSDLTFQVGDGEILGFIGPNGAGKTTTMRILTGFIPASSGVAIVAGHNVETDSMAVRRDVGYLPESPPLYPEMSIGDYLSFVAEIRGVSRNTRKTRVADTMAEVGLSGWEKRIIGSLSKGYRQRVGLAQAIIHKPKILILDEPTSGLDPAQVTGIRSFIQSLASSRTVILSTHILSEVEKLCDRALVIDKGCMKAFGTMDELKQHAGGRRYRAAFLGGVSGAAASVSLLPGVHGVSLESESDVETVISIQADTDPRSDVFRLCVDQGWVLNALETVTPSLEESFLEIVGSER